MIRDTFVDKTLFEQSNIHLVLLNAECVSVLKVLGK